jgi:hypothetical protein
MSPPPLLGLGLALAAAAGNNLGKGLQKAATRHLPQLNLARSEVRVCGLASRVSVSCVMSREWSSVIWGCMRWGGPCKHSAALQQKAGCCCRVVHCSSSCFSCKRSAALQRAAMRHLLQLNLARSVVCGAEKVFGVELIYILCAAAGNINCAKRSRRPAATCHIGSTSLGRSGAPPSCVSMDLAAVFLCCFVGVE